MARIGSSNPKGIKRKRSQASSKDEKSPKKRRMLPNSQKDKGNWKWWKKNGKDQNDNFKWHQLRHNGPVFPPTYKRLPPSVKFYYDKKFIRLSAKAEEVAGFYAKLIKNKQLVSNRVFQRNFLNDWRKIMTAKEKCRIKCLGKCDFKEIYAYYKKESSRKQCLTAHQKNKIKIKANEIERLHGHCLVDRHKQKIANFRIEPPGLFIGRGCNPNMGKLKPRIIPRDVIINIGKKEKIPKPPTGSSWKEVRHDRTVSWLAKWKDPIGGTIKYIMLNSSSKMKCSSDMQKFELARMLKKNIRRIRASYTAHIKSSDVKTSQKAVALYFIDQLSLRAGNEKEQGQSADTVGCCTLRVRNLKLQSSYYFYYTVKLDFLGKDSIRYTNSIYVNKLVYNKLKEFMRGKKANDQVFNQINTRVLNKYLDELMPGLTAKVFRTYNASNKLQEQLNKITKASSSLHEKVSAYNRANIAVAKLCNHQRAEPKNFPKQIASMESRIHKKKEQIGAYKKKIRGQNKKDRNYCQNVKCLETFKDQLEQLNLKIREKKELKTIALGTSKMNYLDPRITVAWCKKHKVPLEKIYSKCQQAKFQWAIDKTSRGFKF